MKNTLKKSTSLFLAMLMIMSCWVFSPMEVGAVNDKAPDTTNAVGKDPNVVAVGNPEYGSGRGVKYDMSATDKTNVVNDAKKGWSTFEVAITCDRGSGMNKDYFNNGVTAFDGKKYGRRLVLEYYDHSGQLVQTDLETLSDKSSDNSKVIDVLTYKNTSTSQKQFKVYGIPKDVYFEVKSDERSGQTAVFQVFFLEPKMTNAATPTGWRNVTEASGGNPKITGNPITYLASGTSGASSKFLRYGYSTTDVDKASYMTNSLATKNTTINISRDNPTQVHTIGPFEVVGKNYNYVTVDKAARTFTPSNGIKITNAASSEYAPTINTKTTITVDSAIVNNKLIKHNTPQVVSNVKFFIDANNNGAYDAGELFDDRTITINTQHYVATFEPNTGESVDTVDVQYKQTPDAPEDPSITNYTFNGWYTTNDTDFMDDVIPDASTKLTDTYETMGDVNWFASFSKIHYLIRLNDESGNLVRELKVYQGDTIDGTQSDFVNSYNKDYNDDYHYIFSGWKNGNTEVNPGDAIYANATYQATYKAVAHSASFWEVKDEATCFAPGTLTGTCSCGKVLEKVNPEDPQLTHNYEIEVITAPKIDVPGTGKYKCTHCGGYETGEIVTIPALREVTFRYNDSIGVVKSYTTSDGSALTAEDYEEVSTFSSNYVPDDYTEDGMIYNFVGWQAESDKGTDTYYTVEDFETLAITASGTYTPYYEAVYEQYDVTYTYTTADGTKTGTTQGDMSKDVYDVLDEYSQNYQTTDKVYVFEGWYQGETKVAQGTTVTAPIVLTAKYAPSPRQYTVTLGGEDFKVNYGEKLQKADVTVADPTKSDDELGHYAFAKWTVGGEDTTSVYDMNITEDITVDAYYAFTAHDSDKEAVITSAGHGTDGVMGHYCSACDKLMSTSVINAYYYVTFMDEDGELTKVQVTKGEVIDSTEIPTAIKAADKTNTYEFKEWTGGDVDAVVTGDVTLTATFDATAIIYTLTFDEDGVITKYTGGYGEEMRIYPSTKEKVIDHILYKFKCWMYDDGPTYTGSMFMFEFDRTYTAVWNTSDVQYTITLDNAGTETTVNGIHDEIITLEAPIAPVGKTFVGWQAADGTMYTDKFVVDVDATLTAVFETSKHTVDFVVDGETFDTVADVKYGTKLNTILPETDPTKAETAQCTYDFKYWTVDGAEVTDETTVVENTTVVAEFDTIIKSVKVTYVDLDGTERTSTVDYGDPFDPTAFVGEAESNKEIHYEFVGWTYLDGSAVTTEGLTSPIKVYAKYDKVPHVYTTETIAPTCTEEGKIIYTCSGGCGFSYEEPIAALGHDLVATRVEPVGEQPGSISKKCSRCTHEEEAIKLWNVVYKVDGSTKETAVAQEGETIYFGSSPRVSDKVENNVNYTMSQWVTQDGTKFDKSANVSYKVTGYTEFTAVWEKSNAFATVTFEYGDEKVSTKKYAIGETPDEPDDLSKLTDDEFEYTFDGWDKEITKVTGDVTYVAQYKKEAKTITVIFKADGKFFSDDTVKTVKAGTAVVAPTLSAEDSFVLEGTKHYTFTGWNVSDKLLSAIKCEGTTLEVTATIKTYLDHDYSKFMGIVQEASCCNPEISKYRCEYCNAVVEVESAPATGKHNFVYEGDRVIDGKTFKVYGCTTCDLENLEEVIIDQHQDIEVGFAFDDKTPADDLNITVYDEENKQVASLVTNSAGKVQLSLDPGTYTVKIEGEGVKTITTKIVVRADGTWDYVDGAPTIPAIKTECTCKCHGDTFWARVFRFFHKIIKLFAGHYVCCGCPSEKYN